MPRKTVINAPHASKAVTPQEHIATHSWSARLESILLQHWYPITPQLTGLMRLLLPLSLLFGQVTHRRRRRLRTLLNFDPSRSINALVVVVGNITTGGTGKTPLLIHLAMQLRAKGLRVAVLSKGYGSQHLRDEGKPRWVTAGDDPGEVGDEPLLIARALAGNGLGDAPAGVTPSELAAIPVVVSKNRCEGLDFLLAGNPPVKENPSLNQKLANNGVNAIDVVLCDDGLQHYQLPRDIEYVVVDGKRGFGNECLLPAGPLREPVSRLASVHQVVVNGSSEDLLALNLNVRCDSANLTQKDSLRLSRAPATMQVLPVGATRLVPASSALAALDVTGVDLTQVLSTVKQVVAVTGTGNPQRFFSGIEPFISSNSSLHTIAFPDHHPFTLEDFLDLVKQLNLSAETAQSVFLVTEKDAVKCRAFAAELPIAIYSVGIQVHLPESALAPILLGIDQLQQWRDPMGSSSAVN